MRSSFKIHLHRSPRIRPGTRFARLFVSILSLFSLWASPVRAAFAGGGIGSDAQALPWADGWTPRSSPVGLTADLAVSADGRVVVVAQDSFWFRPKEPRLSISTDSGTTWRISRLSNQFPVESFAFAAVSGDGARIVVAGFKPEGARAIWTSSDFGVLWESVPIPDGSLHDLDLSRDGRRIVVTEETSLRTTTDLGRTWESTPLPVPPGETSSYPPRVQLSADGQTILVFRPYTDALPAISTNYGATWAPLVFPLATNVFRGDEIALSGDGQHLAIPIWVLPPDWDAKWDDLQTSIAFWISADAGRSWQQTRVALEDQERDDRYFNFGSLSVRGLAISDDGSHLLFGSLSEGFGASGGPTVVTSDSGQTWRQAGRGGWARSVAMSADGGIQFAALRQFPHGPGPVPYGPILQYGINVPPEIVKPTVENGRFSATVYGPNTGTVVLEECFDLSNPDWRPHSTNVLGGGSVILSIPISTHHEGHFFRPRVP